MESGRRNPSRKVRENSEARFEEVKLKKPKTKASSENEEIENVPNKKRAKKEKSDELDNEDVAKSTKTGKSAAKAASSNGGKAKLTAAAPKGKKPVKSKTEDDISPKKTTARPRTVRRSRSVESAKTTAIKKVSRKEAIDEEPSTKAPAKASNPQGDKKFENKVETDYNQIDFSIKEKFNFKISSWNVGGLRALIKKNPAYFEQEDADVVCLNELKCGSENEIPDEAKLDGYHAYWNIGKGEPGVGLLSKVKPLKVWNDIPESDFSDDKRMITAEFKDFYLVAVYVVNAGRGLKTLPKRLDFNKEFDNYIQSLDKKKPVIIAGDMNVAHEEIDLTNPAANKKNAGFTSEERVGFSHLLSLGFVDSFRHFRPKETGAYTFWSYLRQSRPKNIGWRLDYFVVSKRFMKDVKESVIRSEVLGSDHCPIVLFLNL